MSAQPQLHPVPMQVPPPVVHTSFQEATRDFQRELLERTLLELGWNVSAAARAVGVQRSNLYRKMEKFGIERGDTLPED